MEFKQLQSFISVVKYKNFTKAANKNYLSQSTISSHIHQLEEELNVQLFNRTTKNVEVTPKGMELYEYAVNIIELKKRMFLACTADSSKTIYLGASTIPSAYLLPPILSAYSEKYPDVCFTIHQDDSVGVIEQMQEGVIDIGVIGCECNVPGIASIPLCEDHMVLITPITEKYLRIQQESAAPLKELLTCPMIFRESRSGSQKRINEFLHEAGINEEDLNIVARIDDQEAIKNLVANGFGVTMLSERAIRNSSFEEKVLIFDLPHNISTRRFYIIYKSPVELKPHVDRFVQFLRDNT